MSIINGFFSLSVAARVNMSAVCVLHVRIVFMLLLIMVISIMLNFVVVEVHGGLNLYRSAMGHQLSVWIYCLRSHLNLTVVLRIG